MNALGPSYRRLRHRSGRHPSGYDPYTFGGAFILCRVALLYLVSRRMLHSLLAIAAIVVAVWWLGSAVDPAKVTDPFLIPRNQTLIVHMAAAFLASVIGLAIWTPFGETERVSPVMLPVMRAVHLFALLVVGVSGVSIVISTWPEVLPGIDLMTLFVRNTLFLTGCVMLIGKMLDVRLAWMVPIMFAAVTVVAVLQRMPRMESVQEMWRLQSWNVPGQDQTHGVANAVCLGVAIAAIAVYIRDGVRDTDEAE